MSKKIRKILKNIKSKQTVMGVVIIVLLILISATAMLTSPIKMKASAEGSNENQYVTAYETQAYTDYSYYKLITIDSGQVPAILGNFPVWVYNTSSNFTSHILANGSDMAFYSYDNSTQYNHEIELWNKTTGELGVWVKVTSVTSAADTKFWMYYGDSDTTDQPGHNPTTVWSDYTAVWHINETGTGTRYDSTANNYDATPYNYDGDEAYPNGEADGCDWLNSTGATRTDQLNVTGLYNGVPNSSDFTISGWFNIDTAVSQQFISANNDQHGKWSLSAYHTVASSARLYSNAGPIMACSTDTSDGQWHHLVLTRSGNNWVMYLDAKNESYTSNSGWLNDNTPSAYYRIGNEPWGTSTFNGTVDEIRIINGTARNISWIAAHFNNVRNDSTFCTFGSEQEAQGGDTASVYSLKGLPSPYGITWAGTAGTTVWCNATGTHSETMEINMSINSSDNVTEIRVWVDDLNDSGTWINASNISVVISRDNTSWAGGDGSVNYTAFSDGGSNVSINTSQWTDANGMYGTNPFLGAGLKDTNTSLYCRFRITIPSGAATDVFSSLSLTDWKIYIGHYT